MKKREELQEQRRKGFLQNVRQKAEDRSWQRRDIEGQVGLCKGKVYLYSSANGWLMAVLAVSENELAS
jgi:hypothetical protein